MGTLLAPDLTRMSRMTGSFLTTGKVKLARTDAMESMMAEDYSDFIHLKLCDNQRNHRPHDWFDYGQKYRCVGFTKVWEEQMPSRIIRKACDLRVAHTLHIWEVPFLDGHVRYFCPGITTTDQEIVDFLTSFYGKNF